MPLRKRTLLTSILGTSLCLSSALVAVPAVASSSSDLTAAEESFALDSDAAEENYVEMKPSVVVISDDLALAVESAHPKMIKIKPAPEPEPKKKKKKTKPKKKVADTEEQKPKSQPAAEKTAKAQKVPTKEPSTAAADTGEESLGEKIVRDAEQFIGTEYVFGGGDPSGFDCSGLTSYVYGLHGITIPHSSSAQGKIGRQIPREEARPGDLIWSPGHISIYAGGDQQIEATRPGGWTVRQASIWQESPVFIRVTD